MSKDMNVLLGARWAEGLWLCSSWGTPHHRIGDSDSVWEARAVQRRPEAQRWRPDLLGAVWATPWRNPAPAAGEEPPEVLPPLPAGERAPAHVPDEVRRAVKSVYIRNEDLEKYGYTASCGKCQKTRLGRPARGMAHTSACRARIELAMSEADDPRWNAATDRIAHRLEDSVAPAAAAAAPAPGTPVLNEEMLFDAVFAEEEPGEAPSVEWLPIDVSDEARMDLYNAEELETWPVEPEEDRMAGLLILETSTAERREANEILELFLTLGAELPVARAKVAELYSPPREMAKLPRLHLSPGQTFDLRRDRNGRSWNFFGSRQSRSETADPGGEAVHRHRQPAVYELLHL